MSNRESPTRNTGASGYRRWYSWRCSRLVPWPEPRRPSNQYPDPLPLEHQVRHLPFGPRRDHEGPSGGAETTEKPRNLGERVRRGVRLADLSFVEDAGGSGPAIRGLRWVQLGELRLERKPGRGEVVEAGLGRRGPERPLHHVARHVADQPDVIEDRAVHVEHHDTLFDGLREDRGLGGERPGHLRELGRGGRDHRQRLGGVRGGAGPLRSRYARHTPASVSVP